VDNSRPAIATHPVGEAEGDTQDCNAVPIALHHVNTRDQLLTPARTYNGPNIVVLLQGLPPQDWGSGKLIEVGIFSGSLKISFVQGRGTDVMRNS
jgi:hypothetical protein